MSEAEKQPLSSEYYRLENRDNDLYVTIETEKNPFEIKDGDLFITTPKENE